MHRIYPNITGFAIGGKVVGYSPACDKKTHMVKLKDPIDSFTKIIYIPKSYENKNNLKACYKYRNISSVLAADKIIIIGGLYGTLNEFTIGYEMGKEIGVLTGTGGTADIIRVIEKRIQKNAGAKIYYSSHPVKLLKLIGIN